MERRETKILDTHAAIRRLTDAGFPERQAVALVYEFVNLIEFDRAAKAELEKAGTGSL